MEPRFKSNAIKALFELTGEIGTLAEDTVQSIEQQTKLWDLYECLHIALNHCERTGLITYSD